MTTVQRAAAICGALMALPLVTIVAFHAGDAPPPVRATDPPRAAAALPATQPAAPLIEGAPGTKPEPVRRTAIAAAEPPSQSPPDRQQQDYALAPADDTGEGPPSPSPNDVETPARLRLGSLARAKEDPAAQR